MTTGTVMRLLSRHRLRKYLELLDLSERQLSRQAGLGHATVNFLVTGHRTTCTEDTARAIETALDLEPGDLFTPANVPIEKVTRQVTHSGTASSGRGKRQQASRASTC